MKKKTVQKYRLSPETVPDEIAAVMNPADLPSTNAVSSLLLLVGGLDGRATENGDTTLLAAAQAANRITAAVERPQTNDAQPPPSDILAMFRLCEYLYRVEGDIANTIDIPWEIIGKPIEIECEDTGARDLWNELWRQSDEDGMPTLDIDTLDETTYFDVEITGQSFPLEVWDGNELVGIAMVEPESMWVGRVMKVEDVSPDGADLPQKKLDAQSKNLIYNSFVTDQNQQRLPGYRLPIRYDRMLPIYGKKRVQKRYAVPHIIHAARNAMTRQIIEEYRRGTIEQYLSQLWLFVLGDPANPQTTVSPARQGAFNRHLRQAVKNHTGFISTLFPVEAKSLAPSVLDNLLGNEAFEMLTLQIMRDLGFNLFLMSGELPGGRGASAGSSIEFGMQLAIERWKYRTQRFFKWCEYVSRKYAKAQNSPALAKAPPKFIGGSIGIEQYAAIKERIMPLFMAGALDLTNALKVGGFSYEGVLANKKKEKKHADLFSPPATFNQTWQGPNGQTGESKTAPQGTGRPAETGAERPSNKVDASLDDEFEVYGRGEEFRAAIDARLAQDGFFPWMDAQLRTEMLKAYQDGFVQFGGLGELLYDPLLFAPQGLNFQLARLDAFAQEIQSDSDLLLNRPRALMYAGAVNYAYALGAQAAMKSHGATEWQRILHPELSLAGPCPECQADSLVVHAMDEPFFEFHPNGVCTSQSVRYSFAGRAGAVLRVPDFVRKLVRRVR